MYFSFLSSTVHNSIAHLSCTVVTGCYRKSNFISISYQVKIRILVFSGDTSCMSMCQIKFQSRSVKSIKMFRRGQDSNLCGETPFDFESNALTTRPPRPHVLAKRNRGAILSGAICQLSNWLFSELLIILV